MKIELKHYGGCHPEEFLSALRRLFKREGIEKLTVLSLYTQPKLEKTLRLNIAKCDRLVPGTVNDNLDNFDFA